MRLPVCTFSVLLLVICCQPIIAQAGTQKPSLTKDEVAAIRKAAENGDTGAQSKLCIIYGYVAEQGVAQDYAQGAVVWCRKAAEQGNANAQAVLGEIYGSGIGVPRDYAQAAHWIRKAADQGLAVA